MLKNGSGKRKEEDSICGIRGVVVVQLLSYCSFYHSILVSVLLWHKPTWKGMRLELKFGRGTRKIQRLQEILL